MKNILISLLLFVLAVVLFWGAILADKFYRKRNKKRDKKSKNFNFK